MPRLASHRRGQRGLRTAVASAGAASCAAAFGLLLLGRAERPTPSPCAVLPAPRSAHLARAPSAALDRWPHAAAPVGSATGSVSMLPEPVERPLDRYLHRLDRVYNRVVPDWILQYRTAEQQFLYEGDFAVFVREVTPKGCVVQDAVTGIFGFVAAAEYGCQAPAVGDLVQGARCTHMDLTVVQSPDVMGLRMQTGVVFEWDEALGQGYIIPTEGQDAQNMLRVLRRDVLWHGSQRLVVGQFVQFETALPGEVPIKANDDPWAPFALRVRSPEVWFSLRDSYLEPVEGADPRGRFLPRTGIAMQEIPNAEKPLLAEAEAEARIGYLQRAVAAARVQRHAMPVESGRRSPPEVRAHPVLQRWLGGAEQAAKAESPAWLWEPTIRYEEEEDNEPIIPLQLKVMPRPAPIIRIFPHEVAIERGDGWREPAMRRGKKEAAKQMPPGLDEMEKRGFEMQAVREREAARQRRRSKLRANTLPRRGGSSSF